MDAVDMPGEHVCTAHGAQIAAERAKSLVDEVVTEMIRGGAA
jgi:hypothetical protein